MGLFDSIRHSFNPEVRSTFDMLYNKYYKGLKSYCDGTGVTWNGYTLRSRIVLSKDMSYSDMKTIYDAKDTIIDLHNTILQSEKMEADYKEVEQLRAKYPHAFIVICAECLGGVIYDSSIKMPGGSSTTSSRLTLNRKPYYNGQYGRIGSDGFGLYLNSRYSFEPTTVRDLLYPDITKVLGQKHRFASIEKSVLSQLKPEEDRAKALAKQAERQAELARQRAEEQEKKALPSKVSSWNVMYGNFHYTYLLKYYPTTCDFEATEDEWEDRWTVWNFKNTPGKTSAMDHNRALDKVIPKVKSKLINTFGRSAMKYITLVCIPASSAEKTKARYEEFSRRICAETGMTNAYNNMKVVSSSAEKKFGGSGISTDNVSFDANFFRGRYVILFDDVITKGESMLRFKRKMEQLGAIVLGGISIGKTTHQR